MAEIVEDNPVIQQTTIAVRDLPDENKTENKEENNNMIPFATSTGINDNEGIIDSNSTPIGL